MLSRVPLPGIPGLPRSDGRCGERELGNQGCRPFPFEFVGILYGLILHLPGIHLYDREERHRHSPPWTVLKSRKSIGNPRKAHGCTQRLNSSHVHALLLHPHPISISVVFHGLYPTCRQKGEGGSNHHGLPLSLEEAAGPRNGHRLIQHPLADVQVFLDPAVDIFVLGNGLLLETGPTVPEWGLLASDSHKSGTPATSQLPTSVHPDRQRSCEGGVEGCKDGEEGIGICVR